MTFASEEVRHTFHLLPTQKQYEWVSLDSYLAESGKLLHIEEVRQYVDDLFVKLVIRDRLHDEFIGERLGQP